MRAALLGILVLAVPAAGQTVFGTVAGQASGVPLEGAMVILFDATAREVDRSLTDASGRFSLDADTTGTHVLRVDRIGYASVGTGSFELGPEGLFRRIEVPLSPIRLEGLFVEASPRCEVRPAEGLATARVWDEARKALEAAAWTISTGTYSYTLLRYTRSLARNGRDIKEESRDFIYGRSQAPYVSLRPDVVAKRGFVQPLPDGRATYYAPDAEVLLSDEFLDTHCMKLVQGKDGLIGIEVEPTRDRGLPDIEGVLWLDPATAHLRRVEFSYVKLPERIRDPGDIGGEVRFSGLPNGTWVVKEWRIRTPAMAFVGSGMRMVRIGYYEEGGVVWRAIDRSGSTVLEAGTATVIGTVVDSAGQPPLDPAIIRTELGDEARTGIDGSFVMGGLAEGLWELEITHPSLDTLGLSAGFLPVTASLDEVVAVRYRLPTASEVLVEACGGTPRPEGTAIVLGRIRDSNGDPAGPTEVRLSPGLGDSETSARAAPPGGPRGALEPVWDATARPDGTVTLTTSTDARGVFLVCDLPVPLSTTGPAQMLIEVATPSGAGEVRRMTLDPAVPVQIMTIVVGADGRG
jgi:Carboxypeptidase regulatory-like domain